METIIFLAVIAIVGGVVLFKNYGKNEDQLDKTTRVINLPENTGLPQRDSKGRFVKSVK